MLSNPTSTSKHIEEGYVLQVDKKGYCCVQTLSGKIINSVHWLIPAGGSTRAGDRITPHMGDRVIIDYSLGYPMISAFVPRLQGDSDLIPIAIHNGQGSPDTGDYGPAGQIQLDQNQPADLAQGDRVISSVGGSLVGILRAGSLLLRGGRTAEILLSKLRGSIRVFSRNWAHFSDACSDIMTNIASRVYRYTGYAKTYPNSKIENYTFHVYAGDVAAAEARKTDMYNLAALPAATNILYKEQTTSTAQVIMSHRTVNDAGETEIWTTNGTHFTRITITAEEIKIAWNDQNYIDMTQASIHAYHMGGADYIMDNAGIRATFSNGEINMSTSGIDTHFSGADVNITGTAITSTLGSSTTTIASGSITATNGTGSFTVSPATVEMVNGPHSVQVTSAGVIIA